MKTPKPKKGPTAKRPGPGRPRLPEDQRQKQILIRLYPAEMARLLRHGPTAPKAIRAILERARVIFR